MTGRQLSVLLQCCSKDRVLPGAAALYLQQAGRIRQVNWLLKRRLIRKVWGRLVATKAGRRVYAYQRGDWALEQAEYGVAGKPRKA